MKDIDYMRMALELAAKGRGHVTPNPMVGAVVVNNGRVVGRGYHQAAGGPHAEVHALDDAGENARGATLYVTLEPCNHHGRTPPCTEKILQSSVKRVVVAMVDPNPDVAGGGNAYLQSQGIEVTCGLEEPAARRLNESFIKYVRTKRPFVVLKLAATLDGRIATRTGDARWVTGPAARAYGHGLRHALDAILVGAGTVKADDPKLTTRLESGRGVDPIRLVLDTHLSIPETARILDTSSNAPTWVVCGPQAAESGKALLVAKGARILEAPLKAGRIDLDVLMDRLGVMGITSLLIEGGAQVAWDALKTDIVDKIHFFYAPKILGGDDGVPMCRGKGPDLMNQSLGIRDMEVTRLGDDIMVQGYLHPVS